MKNLRLLRGALSAFLCLCLWTIQIHVPSKQLSFEGQRSVSSAPISIGFNDLQAQEMGFTSSVDKDAYPKGYVHLLMMLVISLVSLYLLKDAIKISPDTILFVIGGLLYFISVVTSWYDDKVFEQISENLAEDAQLDALKKERARLVRAKDAASRRIVFLGAATAAFAAAASLAGIMYVKEKLLNKKTQTALKAAQVEVNTAPLKIPQFKQVWPMGPSSLNRESLWPLPYKEDRLKSTKAYLKPSMP